MTLLELPYLWNYREDISMSYADMFNNSQQVAQSLSGQLGSYNGPAWIPSISGQGNMSTIGSTLGSGLGNSGGGFMNSLKSFFGNSDGNMQGMGMNYLGAGIQGLGAIGGLMQNRKAVKLAKDQFKFAKEFANTNLNNQIKTYNTALEDKINARATAMYRDPVERKAYADSFVEKHKLSR